MVLQTIADRSHGDEVDQVGGTVEHFGLKAHALTAMLREKPHRAREWMARERLESHAPRLQFRNANLHVPAHR